MDAAALAASLAQRWNVITAVDALLQANERGDQAAVRALAASATVRFALGGEIGTRLEILACMATSGCPELFDEAREILRSEPQLAAIRFGGHTLLHRAASAWSPQFAAFLLELGADPDACDSAGHPPLYHAGNRFPRPIGVPESAVQTLIEIFVRFGANLNAAEGVKACTPLHMAARRGHASLAEALVSQGANLEARDSKGETPLRRAVNCSQPAVAAALLKLGADPDSRCNYGRTPRDAARTAKMRSLLAEVSMKETPGISDTYLDRITG